MNGDSHLGKYKIAFIDEVGNWFLHYLGDAKLPTYLLSKQTHNYEVVDA